jgi:flagellar protein FlaG
MRYNIPSIESIQSASNAASAGVQNPNQNLTQKIQELQKSDKIATPNKVSTINKSETSLENNLSAQDEVDEIETAVEELNKKLDKNQIAVAFAVDEGSGRIVVQIKDSKSGELLRQVPSDESLQFAHNAQKGVGLLVDSKL